MSMQARITSYGEKGNPNSTARRLRLASPKAMWSRHRDILKNAISLLATTGLTSGLGFAYWEVAAKLFTQQSVGYSDGAIAVMTLLSWIGMFGLGTLLIGELPRRRDRAGLISAAVLASGLGSLVLTLLFILIVPHFTSSFNDVTDSVGRAALLCAAVALTAMTLVLDSGTIGLLRGGIQFSRNLAFVIVKMLTLVAVAIVMHSTFSIGIFLSWVVAIPISLIPTSIYLWRTGKFILPRPDWAVLKSLGKTVIAHNWLNLAIQATPLLMPVIVASMLAPSVNAGFYFAWTITNLLYIVPGHLSTVLFAVASGDPQALAPKLRFTLSVSVLVGIPGMAILGLGAHVILSVFGAGYAKVATLPMELMVLGYLPSIPKCYYIAVCRAVGKISRAAAVLTSFSVLEIVAAAAGCVRYGATGLVVGLLVVGILEALVTLPAVVRAALVRGRHRRVGAAVMAPSAGHARERELGLAANSDRPESDVARAARQQAGLRVLISMAVPVQVALPLVQDSQVLSRD